MNIQKSIPGIMNRTLLKVTHEKRQISERTICGNLHFTLKFSYYLKFTTECYNSSI